MPDLMNPAPGLPDDDFRRAHHENRRSHDDFVVTFISCVSVPAIPAIRNKAPGGRKEAGKGD